MPGKKNSPKPVAIGTVEIFKAREGALKYGQGAHSVVAVGILPVPDDLIYDQVTCHKGRLIFVRWNKRTAKTEVLNMADLA